MRPDRQPDAEYFAVMAAHAEDHWWYRARRELVAQLLAGRVQRGAVALDVGCGTGETLEVLRSLGAATVAGTDLAADALSHARGRGPVVASMAEHLPVGTATVDVVTSMDVIEHLDDDVEALREYRRVLRAGGCLVVTVPAYQSLWSAHDERAGHRRRYTAGQLVAALRDGGFDVERCSYLFSFLVPPALALRRTPLRRLIADTDEDTSGGRRTTQVMATLSRLERRWLASPGRRLPFGLSIVALASAR